MADDVASNRTQESEKSVKNKEKKDARGKQSNGPENLVRKKTSRDPTKPRKKASKGTSNENSKYGAVDAGPGKGAVRSKPTKGTVTEKGGKKSGPLRKADTKATQGKNNVSVMAQPSVMGKVGGVSVMGKVGGGVSVMGKVVLPMKQQPRKAPTKVNTNMAPADIKPTLASKKDEDPKKSKDPAYNYGPVRYDNLKLDQEFQAIIEENLKTTLLSASVHVARFVIVEGNRSCFHVVLQNKTDKHVVFSVVRPPHSRLSVSPKVGFLAPAGHTQVFLMFSCRVQRFPDDLAFVYSIFQQAVRKEDVPLLEDDRKRFSTRNMRQLLKKKPSTHVWHIGLAFGEKPNKGVTSNCDVRLHHLGRYPKLDKEGLIDKEAPYDPNEIDDNDENLPSAEE